MGVRSRSTGSGSGSRGGSPRQESKVVRDRNLLPAAGRHSRAGRNGMEHILLSLPSERGRWDPSTSKRSRNEARSWEAPGSCWPWPWRACLTTSASARFQSPAPCGRLRRDRQARKVLRAKLAELAITDPLTGLYNRRHFEEILRAEVHRIGRYGGNCSLGMIDLDFFKNYNDTLGHLAGDALLRELAALLRGHLRVSDVLARYGGGEVWVVMVKTPQNKAGVGVGRAPGAAWGETLPPRAAPAPPPPAGSRSRCVPASSTP